MKLFKTVPIFLLSIAITACNVQPPAQDNNVTDKSQKMVKNNAQELRTYGGQSRIIAATSARIVRGVSFRTGPSTRSSRIRYLHAGETVAILQQPNRYWYRVQDQVGEIGYVSSNERYIRITGGNQSPAPPPTPAPARVPPTTNVSASVQAQKVIAAGRKYLGTPYEFGSSRSTTRTFDCSDFVRQAFLDGIGLKLPSDSRKQADYVQQYGKRRVTDWRHLQPGDIMFFMSYRGSGASNYSGLDKSTQRITHDGIYLGNGKVLHTYSQEAGGVREDSIVDRHWEYRFIFGGSPF